MMFNDVFLLLTGVVLCIEGVRGAAIEGVRGAASPQIDQHERMHGGVYQGRSIINNGGYGIDTKMMFNGVFLLTGVALCIEGVRGAASPFRFGDLIRSGTGSGGHGNDGDCELVEDELFPLKPPLLMDNNTWTSLIPVQSNGKRIVRIPSGSKIVIACPGTTVIATGTDVTEGVCNGGHVLDVEGANYLMTELGCESRFKETVRREKERCGYGGRGELSSIGYEVTGHPFYKLIEVCFDHALENTLYAKHTLRGKSEAINVWSNFMRDHGFFTVSPLNCYDPTSQKDLMDQLGVNSSLIDPVSGRNFVEGFLAPDRDFPTLNEGQATYHYINAVPQWKPFNNGNWKNMENAVRDLASSRDTDFKVWTGPWGTLELSSIYGFPASIYLGGYENKEALPVPDVMWKVVYEPSTNRGVAFIVVNRPDVTSFPTNLCTDICSLITWIDFNQNDLEKGGIYCCLVEDLRQAIPDAPDLGNVELLAN